MNNKIPLLTAVVFLSILVTLGFILLNGTPAPEEYVQRITRENTEDFFFKKVIDRIPARGVIIYRDIDNETIKVGVSTDPHELNFGVVSQNTTGITKILNIHNKDVNVKTCVVPYGDIKQFVEIKNKEFVMKTDEKREITIRFSGDKIGNYTGEIDVITKKPKYGLLEPLLPFVAC